MKTCSCNIVDPGRRTILAMALPACTMACLGIQTALASPHSTSGPSPQSAKPKNKKVSIIPFTLLMLFILTPLSFAEENKEPNEDMAKMVGTWEWKDDKDGIHKIVTYKWLWNKEISQLVMESKFLRNTNNFLDFPRYVGFEKTEKKLYIYDFYSDGMWSQFKEIKRDGDDIYFEVKIFNGPPTWKHFYAKFTVDGKKIIENYSYELDNWKNFITETFIKVK